VHQNEAFLAVKHRTSGKPLQQLVAVRRLEDRIHRVRRFPNSKTLHAGEKVEVVIAEDRGYTIAQSLGPTQDFERLGAAVHQVTYEPQSVPFRIEGDFPEE
jgi:hypothetical protein